MRKLTFGVIVLFLGCYGWGAILHAVILLYDPEKITFSFEDLFWLATASLVAVIIGAAIMASAIHEEVRK